MRCNVSLTINHCVTVDRLLFNANSLLTIIPRQGRRRLVPAVVGFDEDQDASPEDVSYPYPNTRIYFTTTY